jgi:predicted CXXCH cytochrome family protein
MLANKVVHSPSGAGDCIQCHAEATKAGGKCKSPVSKGWTLKGDTTSLCMGCHQDAVTNKTELHKAIAVRGCTGCHDPHSSPYRALSKTATPEMLCYRCHDKGKIDSGSNVHTAVKQGKCLGCHNAHSGEVAPLLNETRENLCNSCHKLDELAKLHSRHAPATEGRCLDCHSAHKAENVGLLVETGRKLCMSCHDGQKPPQASPPSVNFRVDLTQPNVHKPVAAGDCQVCHSQKHGSTEDALLQKPVAETCFKCHTKFSEIYKFQHSAALLGNCNGCHSPHSSPNKALVKFADGKKLCFSCHQDDITGQKWVHKPLLEKGCVACHDPHGADFRSNLTDGDGRALCAKCHKDKDNAKNVHRATIRYNCTVCHDPHASSNAKGLVKKVQVLCVSCHQKQTDGKHVASMGHKVEGGPDPHDLNRDFSCISCHDPHGSDGKGLFKLKGAVGMEMCGYCHGDKSGKFPELKDISRVKRPTARARPSTPEEPVAGSPTAPPGGPAAAPAAPASPQAAPQTTPPEPSATTPAPDQPKANAPRADALNTKAELDVSRTPAPGRPK